MINTLFWGLFLIYRAAILLEFIPLIQCLLTFIGAQTALLASIASLVQNDIKKVIALSTCSQLGYMLWACGFSLYANSYLHLVNHAFFKALLFMSAGSIIHAVLNEQDLRKLSGIISYLPMSYSCLLIASLSLSGVPFFSGCYSKDHILGLACSQYTIFPNFVFSLATLTACCTAVYSTRLIRLGLAARCSSHHFILRKALNVTEVNNYSTTHWTLVFTNGLLFLLATASLIVGSLLLKCFVGSANPFWGQAMWVEPLNKNVDGEFLNVGIKLLPIIATPFGILLSIVWTGKIQVALSHKWYYDFTINHFIVLPILNLCDRVSFQVMDKGILEIFGPIGTNLWQEWPTAWQSIFSGHLFHSAKIFLVAIIIRIVFKRSND